MQIAGPRVERMAIIHADLGKRGMLSVKASLCSDSPSPLPRKHTHTHNLSCVVLFEAVDCCILFTQKYRRFLTSW